MRTHVNGLLHSIAHAKTCVEQLQAGIGEIARVIGRA